MKPKRLMKVILIISVLLFVWIIFCQWGMKFRMSDNAARKRFLADGVELFTGTVNVDNFFIHYAKTGNDSLPTILFIHGSPGSWITYEHYMKDKDLLKKYRMISIDRPGFGYSEFGNAKNLEEQSKLISPLLEIFNNHQPMYVAGHSMGGPVAAQLVADNPESFAGLVLLSAAMDPAEERTEKWRPLFFKNPWKQLIPGAFLPSNTELWFLKKDLLRLEKDLYKIHCNVWIVHGNKDVYVPVGNAYFSERMLVNAKSIEMKIIPRANHFIHTIHYDIVKDVLMRLHE
jgi:pimeloyl-ACP methyl ester carboxylesterase